MNLSNIIRTTPSPLLTTKLMPPRSGRGTLPRPRLEQLIEQIAEASLTVLKAPPGFGKSTLASAWAEAAQARGARVAWLTLDEADDKPERLLLYVAAAIQRGFGDDYDKSDPFRDFALLPVEHLSTLLLNDLERRDEQCFLFIDDYHCVSPDTLVGAFDTLIRFAPDNLHLVFSGRNDLPPSLFVHLYSDACLEIDASQLRFDLDETRELLLRTGMQEVVAAELINLHQSTEGWIAALRASLPALRHRPIGGTRVPKSISDLLDELLSRLPIELVEQLPHLASVDKFNAELASSLTGNPDGRGLIDELDRLQLFLTELDESAEWFSLHPLFREHLRRRLQPAELRDALRLAARWFAGQQLWPDAVRSALAAGDSDSAQEWIAHCAMGMVERGDFMILLDWQGQLQDCLLQSPSQLKLALAWAAGLAMTRSSSRDLLDKVRSELSALGRFNEEDDLYWESQALQAMLLALDDHGEAGGKLAAQCLPHLSSRPWICNTLLNVVCYSHLATSRWEAFYSLPPTISEPLERSRYLFNQIYRLTLVAFGETLQGRLSQAAAILEEALRLTVSPNGSQGHPVLRALPASFLAGVRYIQGRLDEAARLSLENIEIAKLGGSLDCTAIVFITASQVSSSHANHQGARHFLEEGERLAQTRQWPRLHAQLLLERIRISLLEHKQHEALACTQQLDRLCTLQQSAERLDVYQCLANLAALWCEAAGLGQQADLATAEKLRHQVQQHNQRIMQIRLAAGLALVNWRRQQSDAALGYLLEACNLVDLCGAKQLLVELPTGDALEQLTTYALHRKDLDQTCHAQLQRMLPEPGDSAMPQASHARAALSLTGKERHVLELVAHGKSNKEMGKLLGTTPETIKSHMKNIFSKLNVNSRAQAAVVAKASGLI